MAFLRLTIAVYLGYFCLFLRTAICAPAPPTLSILPNAGSSDLTLAPSIPINGSRPCGPDSSSSTTPPGAAVDWDTGTWRISETLLLAITICNWAPDPATIAAVLSAAATTVGKKPSTALLGKKFTQRSDNKYNTLYFEIGPGYVEPKRLTWGVVGEVLGENGLGKFFETTQQWHTIYFGVVDATQGQLGEGAVRRWWQLESPGGTELD